MSKYYLHKITKDDRQFLKEFDLHLEKGQTAYCLVKKDGTPYQLWKDSQSFLPYYISPILVDKDNKAVTTLAQNMDAYSYYDAYCSYHDISFKKLSALDLLTERFNKYIITNFHEITAIVRGNSNIHPYENTDLFEKCEKIIKAVKQNTKMLHTVSELYLGAENWNTDTMAVDNYISEVPESICCNAMWEDEYAEDEYEEYDEEEEYEEEYE